MRLHAYIMGELEYFSFPENGQGVVPVPEEAWGCVIPGLARRTTNPDDYKNVLHRGKVEQVLDRNKVVLPALTGVAAIVYTKEAYLADPQTSEEEKAAFIRYKHTHCWVATMSWTGPRPPWNAWRSIFSLAGGNAAYADKSIEELVAEAQAEEAYESEWCVVA